MARQHDRWGIGENVFIAIGQIVVAFQRLEWDLGYTLAILKGERENIAKHVAASMFATKLQRCERLYGERIAEFGERGDGLTDSFDEAQKACAAANEARNAIAHAQFGFTPHFDFVIEDLKGKAPGLPIIHAADANPAELFAIVDLIDQANEKLMRFVAKFLGLYLDEYNRGFVDQAGASGDV